MSFSPCLSFYFVRPLAALSWWASRTSMGRLIHHFNLNSKRTIFKLPKMPCRNIHSNIALLKLQCSRTQFKLHAFCTPNCFHLVRIQPSGVRWFRAYSSSKMQLSMWYPQRLYVLRANLFINDVAAEFRLRHNIWMMMEAFVCFTSLRHKFTFMSFCVNGKWKAFMDPSSPFVRGLFASQSLHLISSTVKKIWTRLGAIVTWLEF